MEAHEPTVDDVPARRVTRRVVRTVAAATVVVLGLGYGVATAGPADAPGAPAAGDGCGDHAKPLSTV